MTKWLHNDLDQMKTESQWVYEKGLMWFLEEMEEGNFVEMVKTYEPEMGDNFYVELQ